MLVHLPPIISELVNLAIHNFHCQSFFSNFELECFKPSMFENKIGGAIDSSTQVNSVEFLTDVGWKLSSASYPTRISDHCTIQIDAKTLMVIGGGFKETYIIDDQMVNYFYRKTLLIFIIHLNYFVPN